MKNWWQFTKERFPLGSHITLIVLFVGAHLLTLSQQNVDIVVWKVVITFIVILLFFYKMRLYDEIKDYELDVKINPTRPLPRGLVSLSQVKKGILGCVVAELFLFSLLGGAAAVSMALAIGYSLLMYKEFFIPKWIRPHLTTYAVIHTIITVPMGMAIFAGMNSTLPWNQNYRYWLFALCSWGLFNIFEFGRKTYATEEERDAVESYSKIFGRAGAVILVLVMAIASMFLSFVLIKGFSWMQTLMFMTLVVSGLYYILSNQKKSAGIYRNYSSFYIVLFYLSYFLDLLVFK